MVLIIRDVIRIDEFSKGVNILEAVITVFMWSIITICFTHRYAHLHIHVHTHTNTHIHTQRHTQRHAHTHTCSHTHAQTHTCVHTHRHTHIYTHAHTDTCTHIHTRTHMNTHTHAHADTHQTLVIMLFTLQEQSQALQAVTMLDILTDIHREYRTIRRLEECVLSVNITRMSELLRKMSLLKSALVNYKMKFNCNISIMDGHFNDQDTCPCSPKHSQLYIYILNP